MIPWTLKGGKIPARAESGLSARPGSRGGRSLETFTATGDAAGRIRPLLWSRCLKGLGAKGVDAERAEEGGVARLLVTTCCTIMLQPECPSQCLQWRGLRVIKHVINGTRESVSP
jgi:hypothetical protein